VVGDAGDVAAGGFDVLVELGLLPPQAAIDRGSATSAEQPRKYEIRR
jgi:hypothetical protein